MRMGAPPTLLFDSHNMKAMIQENRRNVTTTNGGSLSSQRVKLLRQTRRKAKPLRKTRKALVKRRGSIVRQGDQTGIVLRKFQTLQRLIPIRESDQGLEALFRDTASYIISLQMRVRVMQIIVDVLEISQYHNE